KIRRVMVSDFAILGLSHFNDVQFQVKAFDATDDIELNRDSVESLGKVLWEHVLCQTEAWAGRLEDLTQNHADVEWAALSMNCCILPLVARDRVLGVLALGKSDDSAYTHDELEYLGHVSNQVTVAVENFLLHAELQKMKDEFGSVEAFPEDESRNE